MMSFSIDQGLKKFFCGLLVSFLIAIPSHGLLAAKKKKTGFTTTEINDAFYDKAWRNFQIGSKKERQDVIKALRAVVKKNPEEFMAHYYLGIMISEEGSATTALKHFETALIGFPKSADIHVRMGKILDEKNKPEEALEHYRKALELDPNNGTALSKVGISELETGNSDKAYELLYKARQVQPDNPDTLRGLGAVLIEKGDNNEAMKVLEQALLFDQKHAETHWLLARAYENLRKPEKAAEHYELAKKYGRRDPEVKELIGYDLARSLMKAGKYSDAEAEYKKALKISPDKGTGYYELALLYSDIGREDDAIKNYLKAYEEDKRFGDGVMKAAYIYLKREDLDNAEALFEMLARDKNFKDKAKEELKDLEDRRKLNEKLRLEAKIEDGKASDKTLEDTYFEMLENNSKDENALKGLWEFYQQRGYYQEALTYFRKYNRLSPVSDFQKKLIEKDLKNKWKLDNYKIFQWKTPIDYKDVKTSDEDLLELAYNGENDRLKELAFDILAYRIGRNKNERSMSEGKPVLEAFVEFYAERGKVKEASKIIDRLKRYGWWTDYEAKEEKRRLREKQK
ncbi:MAG: hypothetical protein Kow0029_29100 [Candidatus Rifleibacteriota bacterium]